MTKHYFFLLEPCPTLASSRGQTENRLQPRTISRTEISGSESVHPAPNRVIFLSGRSIFGRFFDFLRIASRSGQNVPTLCRSRLHPARRPQLPHGPIFFKAYDIGIPIFLGMCCPMVSSHEFVRGNPGSKFGPGLAGRPGRDRICGPDRPKPNCLGLKSRI